MGAHNQGSGPRSNRYSEEKFTNWAEYEPWWLEIQAVWKRFDTRIAKFPSQPKFIELPPAKGFVHACYVEDVENKLMKMNPEFLKDLRAVFLLSGTQKQLKSWYRNISYAGHYWRRCIFLHAIPYTAKAYADYWERFYLHDVLIHELGHHVDQWNDTTRDRERFAEEFVRKHGSAFSRSNYTADT